MSDARVHERNLHRGLLLVAAGRVPTFPLRPGAAMAATRRSLPITAANGRPLRRCRRAASSIPPPMACCANPLIRRALRTRARRSNPSRTSGPGLDRWPPTSRRERGRQEDARARRPVLTDRPAGRASPSHHRSRCSPARRRRLRPRTSRGHGLDCHDSEGLGPDGGHDTTHHSVQ